MKKLTNLFSLLLVSAFSTLTCGCSNNGQENSDEAKIPNIGEQLSLVEGVGFDYEKTFFDDFTNGVNYDNWIISEDCWGSNKGGLTSKNVFYTDEGTLLFRANGEYYSDTEVKGYGQYKDGRCTGASLVSKFLTGPGRYQVKMKPMPRLGACTAFWTYTNRPVPETENDNHEIDIELPGGMRHGVHSFEYMMNTNYLTETYMDNHDFNLAEVTNNQVVYLNDGNFHTFGFDWYTNPEVIVYSVDGIVTQVSKTFIPYLKTRIWVAIWMSISDAFMGAANFETDYLEIDWIKYLPFDSTQPYTEVNVDQVSISAPKEDYPTSPTSRPEVNKIANGDFEYVLRKGKQDGYGWTFEKFLTEEKETKDVCYADPVGGKDGTVGAIIKNGGYMHTTIDAAYSGYQYDLSFDGKSDGTDSVVEVVYYKSYVPDTSPIKSDFITIEKGDWKNYQKTITCPEGCSCMTIEMYNLDQASSSSTFAIDNIKMSRSN